MANLGKITEKEYNQIKAVRNSELGNIERSWAHYKLGTKRTEAMIFGSAFHMYVLEEPTFWENFVVAPQYDGRTKEGKEIKKQLDEIAAAGTKEILRSDDFDTICKMKDSLLKHPMAKNILHRSENEGAYTAEIDGVLCKAKLDLENRGEFFDLKSTEDASPAEFRKTIGKYHYHRQAAFYSDIATANGIPFSSFNLVAVEKKEPFLVCVHTIGEASMMAGRSGPKGYKKILKKFKFHTENPSAYEGYEPIFHPAEAPEWQLREAENDPQEH